MIALHPDTCPRCGGAIVPGQEIVCLPRERARHLACTAQARIQAQAEWDAVREAGKQNGAGGPHSYLPPRVPLWF